MPNFSVKVDFGELDRALKSLAEDQIPFASSLALNRTASAVKHGLVEEMGRVFDRPTPFTLNSLFMKASTKGNLVAYVGIKDESFKAQAPSKWLSPQVVGGPRNVKRFEERLRAAGVLGPNQYAVPATGAKLDGYGNMSRAQIVAILSDVQAHWDTAQNSTLASRQKRGRRRTKRGGVYFAVTTRRGSLRPGVYERIGFGFGSAVRPVLIFTDKAPSYRPRFDMQRVAEDVMSKRYADEVKRAIAETVRSALTRRAAA